MELRLLQAFTQTALAPTFSEAAAALSITQPALTKRIQQLEAVVGTPLFRRGRHGSELTAAGAALLDEARDVVERATRFAARARRVAAGEEGHLTVGFGLSSISVAPRAVAAFRAAVPRVLVGLHDMSSAAQIDGLRVGRIDVGFARLPVPADLRSIPVLRDRLAIAYPEELAPPRDDAALAGWLDDQALVRLTPGRGPGLSAQTARFVDHIGAHPTVIQEADDLQTVLALVAAGVGAAIVPESARNIVPPRVRMTPVADRSASWEVGVVWNPVTETPAVRAFLARLTASSPD
jgi:DNA-binding transcriptional LysR family regulator